MGSMESGGEGKSGGAGDAGIGKTERRPDLGIEGDLCVGH